MTLANGTTAILQIMTLANGTTAILQIMTMVNGTTAHSPDNDNGEWNNGHLPEQKQQKKKVRAVKSQKRL